MALINTCLAYLTSLLNVGSYVYRCGTSLLTTPPIIQVYTATAEVFSEVHVERLLLFSVVWSFGAVLVQERERKRFSRLLRRLTNILPDDDAEFLVFDYYVDESGEWDVWQSKFVAL